jgi:hypothetical protein
MFIAYKPAPLYIARQGDQPDIWIVTEGDEHDAHIIAICPTEAYALAVATALNRTRDHSLRRLGPVTVITHNANLN